MNEVQIPVRRAVLSGNLTLPEKAMALVLFAHGSGERGTVAVINLWRAQSIVRPRNRIFDLLTPEEEALASTLANTDSTSVCWPSALCTHKVDRKTRGNARPPSAHRNFGSRQAALRRWSQPRNFTGLGRSFRVDVPIWPACFAKSPSADIAMSAAKDELSSSLNEMARRQMRGEVSWKLFPAQRTCSEPAHGASDKWQAMVFGLLIANDGIC